MGKASEEGQGPPRAVEPMVMKALELIWKKSWPMWGASHNSNILIAVVKNFIRDYMFFAYNDNCNIL
jgi:hypothetical protein